MSFREGQRCSFNPIKARWASFVWLRPVCKHSENAGWVWAMNCVSWSRHLCHCAFFPMCPMSSSFKELSPELRGTSHLQVLIHNTLLYYEIYAAGYRNAKPTQLQSCNRSRISASMSHSDVVDPSGPVHYIFFCPASSSIRRSWKYITCLSMLNWQAEEFHCFWRFLKSRSKNGCLCHHSQVLENAADSIL